MKLTLLDWDGNVITTGRGWKFRAAVTRLYNQALRPVPRRYLAIHQYYPGRDESHVQMGYYRKDCVSICLDEMIRVRVEK